MELKRRSLRFIEKRVTGLKACPRGTLKKLLFNEVNCKRAVVKDFCSETCLKITEISYGWFRNEYWSEKGRLSKDMFKENMLEAKRKL